GSLRGAQCVGSGLTAHRSLCCPVFRADFDSGVIFE
ncbi:hypothetical protein A2U01_0104077, partial [Trifolium medium]|nr:hypothetical protein [Trifolium medium]